MLVPRPLTPPRSTASGRCRRSEPRRSIPIRISPMKSARSMVTALSSRPVSRFPASSRRSPKIGEELTLLDSGEAIRKNWVASVKDFVSRADQPASRWQFGGQIRSIPRPAALAEEWFAAKREQIVGTTPRAR